MNLAQMESIAVPLGKPDVLSDIEELIRRNAPHEKPRLARLMEMQELMAAGGAYVQDTKPPFASAAYPSVTLSTTSKMLVPATPNTIVKAADWWPGKLYHVRCFGPMTTAATPGNLTIEIRLATADAAGTILATSAAQTLIASQTSISWRAEFYVACWDTGSGGTSGKLAASGIFEVGTAVIAAGQAFLPASAPASTTVDLTADSGISLQFKRSGSTAETAQVFQQVFAALN